jgi:pSer/pThr/pTyr-binding forkhead associated (FHA) protein
MIGRSPQCEILINDNSVSELHGVLRLSRAGVSIADCESTNGTRVNFQLVTPRVPTPVSMSDMLTLGRYTFWLLGAADVVSVIQCDV